jgi:hypothetical protein
MYRELTPNVGECPVANSSVGQCFPVDSIAPRDPVVGLRRLEWIGPLAFKARYGMQPGVDRDFGTCWGPRHDQRVSHRRAALDSVTGRLYAYDLIWDEYAVLAADVTAAAVEAVINRALACDMPLLAEVFARLLADHLAAPTQDVGTTPEFAPGVKP